MNIVFMSMDTLPSTLWARDLYDQMHIRSDFRKWFPRMCQYGFIEGRDYEYMPRVRLQDEGGRTVQRYVKDYRITQDMAKKLCKLHHTAVGAAYHPQPFDWDTRLRNKIFRKYKASGYAGVEAIFERDQRNQKFIWGMYDRICGMFCRKTR